MGFGLGAVISAASEINGLEVWSRAGKLNVLLRRFFEQLEKLFRMRALDVVHRDAQTVLRRN
jgi:hypothetical protein